MSFINTTFGVNSFGISKDVSQYVSNEKNVCFQSFDYTNKKYSITYDNPATIKTSDITAILNGVSNTGQTVFTFGPTIPNQWIAVGNSRLTSGNTMAYSSDGINWSGLGNTIFAKQGSGITWNGSMWVATGQGSAQGVGNTIAYSLDGLTWTGRGARVLTIQGNCSAWNGKNWIAGGSSSTTGNTSAISYDGINWTGTRNGTTVGTQILGNTVNGLAWNGAKWSAVGKGIGNNIAISNDGVNWTDPTGPIGTFANYGNNIFWNGLLWSAVGNGGNSVAYSKDGYSWTGGALTTLSVYGQGVGWNGFRWLINGSGTNNSAYSINGVNWTSISGKPIFSNYANCVVWNGTKWFVGGSGSANTLAYAIENSLGISVSSGNIALSAQVNAIAYNSKRPHTITFPQNLTVAVGSGGNSIVYSQDGGVTWTGTTGTSIFSTGSAVATNGKMWVAGGSGTNTLAYSYDGNVWTGLGKSVFSTVANALLWNGKMWLGGGQGVNTMAYSYDGITWLGLGTSIFSVSGLGFGWNGKMWVAGGTGATNTLAYSYNGINWTGLGKTVFNTSVNSICWNGKIWNVGGSGTVNALAYSYNGINWTGLGKSFFLSVNCISVNKQNIVAVGNCPGISPNSIAISQDGINWISQGSIITGSNITSITYNGFQWIAGNNSSNGFILNPFTYSFDGLNYTNSIITLNVTGNTITSVSCDISGQYLIYTTKNDAAAYLSDTYGASFVSPYPAGGPNPIVQYSTTYTYTGEKGAGYSIAGAGGGGLISMIYSPFAGNTTPHSFDIGFSGGNATNFMSCRPFVVANTVSSQLFKTFGQVDKSSLIPTKYTITSASISVNNQYTILGGYSNSYGTGYAGPVYLSSDYIASFTLVSAPWNISTTNVNPVLTAASSTGQYMSVLLYSMGIYTSSNYGVTWTSTPAGGGITGYNTTYITKPGYISDSGQFQQFMNQGPDGLYIISSCDYGANWISKKKIYNAIGEVTYTAYSRNMEYQYIASGGNLYAVNNSITQIPINSVNSITSNYNIPATVYIQQPTIAVGQGTHTLAYSPEGITWRGLGATIFSQQANAIVWNGTYWIAGGSSSSGIGNTMAYSLDGTNWTGLGNSTFSGAVYGLAWNGNTFVATGRGSNSIAYSYDGINWQGSNLSTNIFSGAGYGVAWNGNTYVAVGTGIGGIGNTIAYSSDGITWTGSASGKIAITQQGNCIVWNGVSARWVAGGSGIGGIGNTIAYSSDGITWTGSALGTTAITSTVNSVAFNGIRMVAVGSCIGGIGNTIAYSTDGITWTGAGKTVIQTCANGVAWNGVRFIATGQGTAGTGNTLAYSQDGITWYGSITNSSQIFTTGYGVASNPNMGPVAIDSQIVLDNNGISGTQTLDIVSDAYYQTGWDNCAITINNKY